MTEAIIVSSIAIVSEMGVLIVAISENIGNIWFPASLVLCIVCSSIAVASIWRLVVGRTHVVHISDAGIEWNNHRFDWDAVRQIRWQEGPPGKLGLLTFTVSRSGFRPRLALPVFVSESAATALRDDLRAFLSSTGYPIRWMN